MRAPIVAKFTANGARQSSGMMRLISKTRFFPLCGLIIGALVFTASTPVLSDTGKASIAMRALDQILGEDLLQNTGLTFNRAVAHREHVRIYSYSSREEKSGNPIAIITISVAASGRFIGTATGGEDTSAAGAKASNSQPLSIGAVSVDRGTLISPDTVVSEVWFRTTDNLFDVKVIVFEASSNVDHAELSGVSVAETVAAAYHNTMK